LFGRTFLWTALALIAQPNASLDLIEWLVWGREWQWGYPKHPPLPAWIAEVFSRLAPSDTWGVVLAGYVFVGIALWAVWRLGREILQPRLALVAAMAMEGLIYFTADAAEFSNNVVLDAFWAVAILCFHRALRTERIQWWIGLGLAFGLGLLSKYTMALLLAPMVGYVVYDGAWRGLVRRPGPYLAALIAGGLFAPHVTWMVQRDFITVRYSMMRTAAEGHWTNHLRNPTVFALTQLGFVVPIVLVLAPLISQRCPVGKGRRRDLEFLLAMVLGPLALLLTASLVTGIRLRDIWGSPLWSFAGVLLLVGLPTQATAAAFGNVRRNFTLVIVAFSLFVALKPVAEPWLWGRAGRAQFPGKALGRAVTEEWHRVNGRRLPIVVGECWLAGNVCCYSPDRPSMYSSGVVGCLRFDESATPWTGDEDVRRRGGALVWDAGVEGEDLPVVFRERFPGAGPTMLIELPPQTLRPLPPMRFGVAFVPPDPQAR
jgi:hypothetical protein